MLRFVSGFFSFALPSSSFFPSLLSPTFLASFFPPLFPPGPRYLCCPDALAFCSDSIVSLSLDLIWSVICSWIDLSVFFGGNFLSGVIFEASNLSFVELDIFGVSLSSLLEPLEMRGSDGGGFKGVTVLAGTFNDSPSSFLLTLLIPNLSLTIWVDAFELWDRDESTGFCWLCSMLLPLLWSFCIISMFLNWFPVGPMFILFKAIGKPSGMLGFPMWLFPNPYITLPPLKWPYCAGSILYWLACSLLLFPPLLSIWLLLCIMLLPYPWPFCIANPLLIIPLYPGVPWYWCIMLFPLGWPFCIILPSISGWCFSSLLTLLLFTFMLCIALVPRFWPLCISGTLLVNPPMLWCPYGWYIMLFPLLWPFCIIPWLFIMYGWKGWYCGIPLLNIWGAPLAAPIPCWCGLNPGPTFAQLPFPEPDWLGLVVCCWATLVKDNSTPSLILPLFITVVDLSTLTLLFSFCSIVFDGDFCSIIDLVLLGLYRASLYDLLTIIILVATGLGGYHGLPLL